MIALSFSVEVQVCRVLVNRRPKWSPVLKRPDVGTHRNGLPRSDQSLVGVDRPNTRASSSST
jgi:hypothetical protein